MRIIFLKSIIIIVLFSCCLSVQAQHFDPEHRHSLELSTGFLPVQTSSEYLARGGILSVPYETIKEVITGKSLIPNFNIAYNFVLSEYWDLNAIVNLSKTIVTPMVDLRWKWLRRENMRLYSSLGIGCIMMDNFNFVSPYPYLTPIGISFGKGEIYGLAELNFSNAATFLLIGAGIRF